MEPQLVGRNSKEPLGSAYDRIKRSLMIIGIGFLSIGFLYTGYKSIHQEGYPGPILPTAQPGLLEDFKDSYRAPNPYPGPGDASDISSDCVPLSGLVYSVVVEHYGQSDAYKQPFSIVQQRHGGIIHSTWTLGDLDAAVEVAQKGEGAWPVIGDQESVQVCFP